MSENKIEEMLEFFKALSDANRLKIIGLLAQGEYSVEELAEILSLRASTVSHHLSRLSQVGLVSARSESYYNIYRLEMATLESLAQGLLSTSILPEIVEDVPVDAYDQKVVRDYTLPNGRLRDIPSQRKKREAVLRHMVRLFEYGRVYTEKEVNQVLGQFHEDTALLRREMIGYGFMKRDKAGTAYERL